MDALERKQQLAKRVKVRPPCSCRRAAANPAVRARPVRGRVELVRQPIQMNDVENRQVKYNLPIEEDALVGFLSKQGLTQVEGSDAQEGAGKDEL